MNRSIAVAVLVCLNAALVVALVFGTTSQTAHAQVVGANYLVTTGQINADNDAVWVLDLASRRLAALRFDKTKKRLVAIGPTGGRDLRRDFSRASR